MRKARKVALLGAAVLVLVLGVVAASALAATSLSIASKGPCCKFSATKLSAKAGKVTVRFTNRSGGVVPHNFRIKGRKGTRTIKKGSASVTVTLRKGKYTFLCTVPTHATNGMKGTLTVR